jgi:uncharacterized protein (TIGR00290 family)
MKNKFKHMKAFASWSGGKDCMLAAHRILKQNKIEITHLVNMCDTDDMHSRSHGIKKEFIQQQAKAINIALIQKAIDNSGYEACFKAVIQTLKEEGVEAGIFGDIYLMEHRTWIERVCKEMDITPLFPLWENDTNELLKEFIDEGFHSITVAINTNFLDHNWLGRNMDNSFYTDITALENIDPCAENGEYHSFVFDGPIFSDSIEINKGEVTHKNNHSFLELTL